MAEQKKNTLEPLLDGGRQMQTVTIVRGVLRLFRRLGQAALPEVVLGNGRRADVLAIDREGGLTIVEVKSSWEDFRADHKWQAYQDHCDRFAFAVGPDFPLARLPAAVGVIVADAYDAVVLRTPAAGHRLAPARRRAITVAFAHIAAGRLAGLVDPLDDQPRP